MEKRIEHEELKEETNSIKHEYYEERNKQEQQERKLSEEKVIASPHSLRSAIPRQTSPRRPFLRTLSSPSSEHHKNDQNGNERATSALLQQPEQLSSVKNDVKNNSFEETRMSENHHNKQFVSSPPATSISKSNATRSNNSAYLAKSPPSSAREELRRILMLDNVGSEWTRSPTRSQHHDKNSALHSSITTINSISSNNNTNINKNIDKEDKHDMQDLKQAKLSIHSSNKEKSKPPSSTKLISLRHVISSPHSLLLPPPLISHTQTQNEQTQQEVLSLSPSTSPFPLVTLLRSPLSESDKSNQLILLENVLKLPLERPFLYKSGKSPLTRTRSLASSIAPTVVSSEASFLPELSQQHLSRQLLQQQQQPMNITFNLHSPLVVTSLDKMMTPFFLGFSWNYLSNIFLFPLERGTWMELDPERTNDNSYWFTSLGDKGVKMMKMAVKYNLIGQITRKESREDEEAANATREVTPRRRTRVVQVEFKVPTSALFSSVIKGKPNPEYNVNDNEDKEHENDEDDDDDEEEDEAVDTNKSVQERIRPSHSNSSGMSTLSEKPSSASDSSSSSSPYLFYSLSEEREEESLPESEFEQTRPAQHDDHVSPAAAAVADGGNLEDSNNVATTTTMESIIEEDNNIRKNSNNNNKNKEKRESNEKEEPVIPHVVHVEEWSKYHPLYTLHNTENKLDYLLSLTSHPTSSSSSPSSLVAVPSTTFPTKQPSNDGRRGESESESPSLNIPQTKNNSDTVVHRTQSQPVLRTIQQSVTPPTRKDEPIIDNKPSKDTPNIKSNNNNSVSEGGDEGIKATASPLKRRVLSLNELPLSQTKQEELYNRLTSTPELVQRPESASSVQETPERKHWLRHLENNFTEKQWEYKKHKDQYKADETAMKKMMKMMSTKKGNHFKYNEWHPISCCGEDVTDDKNKLLQQLNSNNSNDYSKDNWKSLDDTSNNEGRMSKPSWDISELTVENVTSARSDRNGEGNVNNTATRRKGVFDDNFLYYTKSSESISPKESDSVEMAVSKIKSLPQFIPRESLESNPSVTSPSLTLPSLNKLLSFSRRTNDNKANHSANSNNDTDADADLHNYRRAHRHFLCQFTAEPVNEKESSDRNNDNSTLHHDTCIRFTITVPRKCCIPWNLFELKMLQKGLLYKELKRYIISAYKGKSADFDIVREIISVTINNEEEVLHREAEVSLQAKNEDGSRSNILDSIYVASLYALRSKVNVMHTQCYLKSCVAQHSFASMELEQIHLLETMALADAERAIQYDTTCSEYYTIAIFLYMERLLLLLTSGSHTSHMKKEKNKVTDKILELISRANASCKFLAPSFTRTVRLATVMLHSQQEEQQNVELIKGNVKVDNDSAEFIVGVVQLRNALHDCYTRNTNITHDKAITYTPFPDKLTRNKDEMTEAKKEETEAVKVGNNEDDGKDVDDDNKSSRLASKKVATISKVPSMLTLGNSWSGKHNSPLTTDIEVELKGDANVIMSNNTNDNIIVNDKKDDDTNNDKTVIPYDMYSQWEALLQYIYANINYTVLHSSFISHYLYDDNAVIDKDESFLIKPSTKHNTLMRTMNDFHHTRTDSILSDSGILNDSDSEFMSSVHKTTTTTRKEEKSKDNTPEKLNYDKLLEDKKKAMKLYCTQMHFFSRQLRLHATRSFSKDALIWEEAVSVTLPIILDSANSYCTHCGVVISESKETTLLNSKEATTRLFCSWECYLCFSISYVNTHDEVHRVFSAFESKIHNLYTKWQHYCQSDSNNNNNNNLDGSNSNNRKTEINEISQEITLMNINALRLVYKVLLVLVHRLMPLETLDNSKHYVEELVKKGVSKQTIELFVEECKTTQKEELQYIEEILATHHLLENKVSKSDDCNINEQVLQYDWSASHNVNDPNNLLLAEMVLNALHIPFVADTSYMSKSQEHQLTSNTITREHDNDRDHREYTCAWQLVSQFCKELQTAISAYNDSGTHTSENDGKEEKEQQSYRSMHIFWRCLQSPAFALQLYDFCYSSYCVLSLPHSTVDKQLSQGKPSLIHDLSNYVMVISPLASLASDLHSFADIIAHGEKEMCATKCVANVTETIDDLDKADTDMEHHICLLRSLNIPASRFFIEHALLRREHTAESNDKPTAPTQLNLKTFGQNVMHNLNDPHKSTEDSFLSLNSNIGKAELLLQQSNHLFNKNINSQNESQEKKSLNTFNTTVNELSNSPQLETPPELVPVSISHEPPHQQQQQELLSPHTSNQVTKDEEKSTEENEEHDTFNMPSPSLLTFPSLVTEQAVRNESTNYTGTTSNTIKDDKNDTGKNNLEVATPPSIHNSTSKTSYHVAVPSTVVSSQEIIPSKGKTNNASTNLTNKFRLAYEISANLAMQLHTLREDDTIVTSNADGNIVMFKESNDSSNNFKESVANAKGKKQSRKMLLSVHAAKDIAKNDIFCHVSNCCTMHKSD